MKGFKIKDDLYWTGVIDKDLRVFDIIMETKYGTTYNAFVLKGSEKIALFETAKAGFNDEFIKRLQDIVDISKIDYLVVEHTEPDHSGSIERLLAINPNIEIVGTAAGITFLKKIVNHQFKSRVVKDGDIISLGNKTLEFMPLPNLHWPDTMFTYVKEDKLLFTCDVFGAHYSDPAILRSKIENQEEYKEALKYYFDHILKPFISPFMHNALKRIADLEIEFICTGHGAVIDTGIDEIMAFYHKWSTLPQKSDNMLVVIPYVSAYGYTKTLAETIAKALLDDGGIDVELYDMVDDSQAVVLERMAIADGIMFGSPTMVGEALKPIWDLATSITSVNYKDRLMSAFGSYGWSGEAVINLTERLRQLKADVVDGYRIRFKPNEEDLKGAYEYGSNFALRLKEKMK